MARFNTVEKMIKLLEMSSEEFETYLNSGPSVGEIIELYNFNNEVIQQYTDEDDLQAKRAAEKATKRKAEQEAKKEAARRIAAEKEAKRVAAHAAKKEASIRAEHERSVRQRKLVELYAYNNVVSTYAALKKADEAYKAAVVYYRSVFQPIIQQSAQPSSSLEHNPKKRSLDM